MNGIKNVLGAVWAVWLFIMFVVTMLIFLIPFLLFSYFAPEPRRTARFIAYSRVWMDIYLPLIGCPLKKIGREHFLPGQNYIVTCNHNSFLDIMAITPAIPGANKTIAKIEMAKVPIFGMMYRVGSILVDRKSDQSRKESFSKMKDTLKMGLHMCIYPEGSRNRSNEPLKPFHSGAFRLAADTGKPIIPALMFNSRKALPADKAFYAMPHALSLHFLPAVHMLPEETAADLQQRVFDIMYRYYKENQR